MNKTISWKMSGLVLLLSAALYFSGCSENPGTDSARMNNGGQSLTAQSVVTSSKSVTDSFSHEGTPGNADVIAVIQQQDPSMLYNGNTLYFTTADHISISLVYRNDVWAYTAVAYYSGNVPGSSSSSSSSGLPASTTITTTVNNTGSFYNYGGMPSDQQVADFIKQGSPSMPYSNIYYQGVLYYSSTRVLSKFQVNPAGSGSVQYVWAYTAVVTYTGTVYLH